MNKDEILKKVEELITAKEAVIWCLNNPIGLAGMHGLSHWAGVVDRLRKELKELL